MEKFDKIIVLYKLPSLFFVNKYLVIGFFAEVC